MLEFLGEDEAAATITSAVQDYARTTTNNQATTTEIGDAIAGKVR